MDSRTYRYIGLTFVAVLVLVLVSPWFGYAYEPLDKVAEQLGVEEKNLYNAPLPDYTVPGIANESLSSISAGIIGAVLLFGVCYLFAKIFKKT